MTWSFPYLGETEDLDDHARACCPGEFVQVENGFTHYQLAGPRSGQPVVLVHGFSVPYFIWDPTFQFLSSRGFRVLRYDLFGRGLSDRPRIRYTIDLFCKQLRDVLDTLAIEGPVHLIGLSMGGPITATYASRFPGRVKRLVLIDPAGAREVKLGIGFKGATLPGLGELLFGLFGGEALIKGIAADFFGPDLVAQFQEKYWIQMRYKGFKRAILSTIRNGMLGDFATIYRELGQQNLPTLLVWGENDRTIPPSQSEVIRALIPSIEFHCIRNSGHVPHFEQPDEVNRILAKFLIR